MVIYLFKSYSSRSEKENERKKLTKEKKKTSFDFLPNYNAFLVPSFT